MHFNAISNHYHAIIHHFKPYQSPSIAFNMAVCQNLVPLVNIKIAGKWMFIPLKMVLIGIDPTPYQDIPTLDNQLRPDRCRQAASAASASWIQRPQERVSNSKAKGVPCDLVQFLKGHASWRWDAGMAGMLGWLVFYWDDFGDQSPSFAHGLKVEERHKS